MVKLSSLYYRGRIKSNQAAGDLNSNTIGNKSGWRSIGFRPGTPMLLGVFMGRVELKYVWCRAGLGYGPMFLKPSKPISQRVFMGWVRSGPHIKCLAQVQPTSNMSGPSSPVVNQAEPIWFFLSLVWANRQLTTAHKTYLDRAGIRPFYYLIQAWPKY